MHSIKSFCLQGSPHRFARAASKTTSPAATVIVPKSCARYKVEAKLQYSFCSSGSSGPVASRAFNLCFIEN